jgi:hypothetical protein
MSRVGNEVMKKSYVSLLIFLALGAAAQAQTTRTRVSARVAQSTGDATDGNSQTAIKDSPSISGPELSGAPIAFNREDSSRPPLMVVIDTSPSVRNKLPQIRAVGKRLVQIAPDGIPVGVVGIDSQAKKKLCVRSLDADEFIDSLTAGGRFTDLGRGTDAVLSLLQETSATRAAVVYLTDGELVVPKDFRDRANFTQVLKREFTPRPGIQVFVINVKGKTLPDSESLPPNVTVISLSDWQSVQKEIEKDLAAKIGQQLRPVPVASVSAPERIGLEHQPALWKTSRILMVTIGLLALAIAGAAVMRRRKRRNAAAIKVERPDNAMRAEDLDSPSRVVTAPPEPVLMLEAGLKDDRSHGGPFRRAYLRSGEKLIIGGSDFANLCLEGLEQSQTVELLFDGEVLRGFRLRPDRPGSVDEVLVDGREAQISFVLKSGSQMILGRYRLDPVVIDEASVTLFDTPKGSTSVSVVSANSLRRRKLIRGKQRTDIVQDLGL